MWGLVVPRRQGQLPPGAWTHTAVGLSGVPHHCELLEALVGISVKRLSPVVYSGRGVLDTVGGTRRISWLQTCAAGKEPKALCSR